MTDQPMADRSTAADQPRGVQQSWTARTRGFEARTLTASAPAPSGDDLRRRANDAAWERLHRRIPW